jgi:hypothetical protein
MHRLTIALFAIPLLVSASNFRDDVDVLIVRLFQAVPVPK